MEIVGDASSLHRAFGQASKSGSVFSRGLGRVAKGAAIAMGAAGIGGLALTLRAGVKEFAEAARVGAQTGAVLKSTGGIAKVSARQVSDLAGALMRKSGVDDEAIQSGENMLLTFTRIRNEAGRGNDIFTQATKATLDLSVAMKKDMPSAAILVGKALNDPIKGMAALGRAGIQFTDAQKDSIKAMVQSGNVMGAQKAILKELTTQFGGSAEAVGKTLPGKINILKESFSNLAGGIVGSLAPAFSTAVKAASGFVERLSAAKGMQAKIAIVWEAARDLGSWLLGSIKDAVASIDWGAVWAGARGFVDGAAQMVREGGKVAQMAATVAVALGAYKVALLASAAAAKIATVASAGLMTSLKLNPLGLVFGAVAALAGAMILLRKPTRDVNDAFRDTAAAARSAAAAIRDQAAATDRLKGASLDVVQAQLRIKEAVLRERDTRGTKDHAQAVIDLKRAEIDLREATRSRATASEEAVKSSRKATAEARASTAAARESLKAEEYLVATQGRGEGTLARLSRAQRENIQALTRGAQKHREIAAEALRQAAATNTATQSGRDLKRALEGVARVNIDAAIAAGLRGIGFAASFAEGEVRALVGRLREANSAPRPSAGGGGGGGKKKGGGEKKSDERSSFADPGMQIRAAAAAQLAEVNRIQSRIDAIQATRAAKDRMFAAREAVAALAEARKKHEGVAAAERALVAAKEAITIAGGERWLGITQRNLERMNTLLATARDRIGNSFQGMADRVTRAFDAITAAHKTATEQLLGSKTKSEGDLGTIQVRRREEDQAEAVADAERALAATRANPEATANEIADAERALARAREDITITSLEKMAEEERAGLEKTAQAERTAWEQERAALRERLDARLAALQAHFTTEGATVSTATGKIAATLAEFGIQFADVGALLGDSFVTALTDAINGLSVSAGNLLDLKVSVKKAPKGAKKLKGIGRIPGLAHGGIVTRPTLAMIGEAGPEAVVPLSRGGRGGGNTFNFSFPAYVGDKRELVEMIRTELIRGGRRMPGVLGGLA